MFQFTRTQTFVLVRTSRIAQMVVAGLVIFLIATGALFYNMKTINVTINGEPVYITTIFGTVGQALSHSKIKFYPEDIVIPSRETMVTKGLAVEVTKSLPVQFSVNDQTFSTRTAAKTVGDAITELAGRYGIEVKEVDEVNVSRFEEVTSQMEIKVRKAIPIIVNADGKKSETYIAPRSVAEALEKLGITLGAKDKISLALEHMLEPNDQLNVVRVTERIETVKSEIPYQTVAQAADFPVGLPDKLVSRGSNGAQEQTVRLTLEDGKEVDREILGQRVVRAPINQVVSRGAQTSISRGGSTIYFKRAYVMKASAYCSPGGTTATGVAVSSGIVAVDPKVIPLGQKVYVEGYGSAHALDTGGAIRGNRIDLYMNSDQEALSWGVRNVLVYVQ
ncbi:Cell wall-binding protein [Desulfosporosinus sp. I2]|uniref:3D domain-containing protein n=1 Tax=Desulfosporosinus sp. I2 TaxID=1617025 RepID=UPI0005F0BFA1|nr:3D domain-containing protein [Desulfosporosinus sp. I2]KJR47185.1 Cell wall-binding protein [Desulfosporosinus sp. I2]